MSIAIVSNPSFERGPPKIMDICLPFVPTPCNKITLTGAFLFRKQSKCTSCPFQFHHSSVG